jgi:tRNA nucleotidyltransferase/poly(A) polymerase
MPGKGREEEQQSEPYAGRWVALLNGQVVAHGGTREQALKASKATRPKENPEIIFMPTNISFSLPPIIERIRGHIPQDKTVFLVGGAVRDLLLQRRVRDLDFALAAPAIPLARKLADKLGGAFYALDKDRDAGRVILKDEGQTITLDFVAQREASLESDLRARDFTINAMAINLREPDALLDPLGGVADLQAKQLRACSARSMEDDPIRVLRAVRMAASIDLRIEKQTRAWMKAASAQLIDVSAERLRDELFRLLSAPRIATSFRALEMIGSLNMLPEVGKLIEQERWEQALQRVASLEKILAVLELDYPDDGARDLQTGLVVLRLGRYREQISTHLSEEKVSGRSRRSLLFLAALFQDIDKIPDGDGVGTISHQGEELRLSKSEITDLKTMQANHGKIATLSNSGRTPDKRSIYQFFRVRGKAGVESCLLALADLMSHHGAELTQEMLTRHLDTTRALLEAYWEHYDEVVSPTALLSGDELMAEFDLKASARIGEILEALLEAQAAGEINNRKEALAFAEGLIK